MMTTTYPYLDTWLQCLWQLAPPNGLVHIGAGAGASADEQPYPYAHMPRLLVVEAHALHHARLQTQLEHREHSQVVQAVVAAQSGSADFHTLSQSQESGLNPASVLQALWPNIKTLHTDTVPTTTLQALAAQTQDGATAFNWAVIDCLPADQVLRGAGDLVHGWDVVVVRALQTVPANANAATQAMGLPALREQLAVFGLQWVAQQEENHPHMVRALFVRDPSEQKKQWARDNAALSASLAAARDEHAHLANTQQTTLASMQAQCDSLEQEARLLRAAHQAQELRWLRQQQELKKAQAKITLIQQLLAPLDAEAPPPLTATTT